MRRRYPTPRRRWPIGPIYSITLLLCVALTVALAWWCGKFLGLQPLVAYLLGINIATILAYGYDKSIANSRSSVSASRVPENVLQLLALAGGSPGALVGQSAFRHKTTKRSFRTRFWSIVILQVIVMAVWLYLHRPH